jgi:hypothetical protein
MLAGRIGVLPPERASTDTKCSGSPFRKYLELLQDESMSASRELVTTPAGSTLTSRVCSSLMTTRRPKR